MPSTNHCLQASHAPRTYRGLVRSDLKAVRVVVQETDLHIYCDAQINDAAREVVIEQRSYLEAYIRLHPAFLHAMY
ncbi:MAG: hypothetical protein HKP58_16335, partial [Desulfatitalea sp.]|nr:hypothetical protein [Desulfatitalea sp.]NNK01982.1 hypothetical protein [Desulfatitalea sp.]